MLIDPPAVPVRPLFDIQLTRQPYTSIDLPCRGVVLLRSDDALQGMRREPSEQANEPGAGKISTAFHFLDHLASHAEIIFPHLKNNQMLLTNHAAGTRLVGVGKISGSSKTPYRP